MSSRHIPKSYESERGYYAEGLGDDDIRDTAPAMTTPSGAATRQAEAPWYQDVIKAVVPAAMSIYQQNQMTKLNLARINSGYPPMTGAEYAAVYQPPAAQFQVGPTADMKKMMVYAALAGLAFFGLRAAKVI